MAQLKDLIVSGPTRLVGDATANNIQITSIKAHTAVNGSTFGSGESGQVLTSDGTALYWHSPSYNDLTNKPNIPTLPSNIVNTITTTAGTHTVITSQKGNVSFKIPTKTSHLTNDSGFITTYSDEKLKIGAVANNTTNSTYYPILATNSTTAATRYYDSTGIHYNNVNGSTTAVGKADLVLGNSTASGNANNKKGTISLYSSTSNYGYFTTADLTDQRTYTFPDKTGTVALTSDIPTSMDSNTTGITASTTATKTTLGTANSVIGVQSETTTASKVTVGSHATDYGVTAAGSGSASLTFTIDTIDTQQLNITFSHTHVAPTLGSKVPTVSASNVTVPIKNTSSTSIPNVSVAAATVSITDPGHTHTI